MIDGSTGSIIGRTLGFSELGPEKQTEIETGFDLGLIKTEFNLILLIILKTLRTLFYKFRYQVQLVLQTVG